jgi:acyl dehydratase
MTTTAEKPAPRWCYEDFSIGQVMDLGSIRVSKDEIVAYARTFDPQPLHLDEEAARHTIVGRLCASGWHSCAILTRLMCDAYLLDSSSLGSPGMEEVRFLKPVFPDDDLSGRMTVREMRPLRSRPGVGIIRLWFELINGNGDIVLTWDTNQLFGMRHPPVAMEART